MYSFVQRLFYGLKLTLLVTFLSPLVQITMHKVISPDFFQNVIYMAVENNLLTQDDALSKFNLKNYIFENLLGTFLLGSGLSLLLAAIFHKIKK